MLWEVLIGHLPLQTLRVATLGGVLIGLCQRYLGDHPKRINEAISEIGETGRLDYKARSAGRAHRGHFPDLLEMKGLSVPDLMYGARLATGTAYRLANGDAERISFPVLSRLCSFLKVGVQDILEYIPDSQKE